MESSRSIAEASRSFTSKKFILQLKRFFDSPFKDDRRFAIHYISLLTRDRIDDSEKVVNTLFYEHTLSDLLMDPRDEINRYRSLEILCNMTQSDHQRKKLSENGYFQWVF